MTIHAVVLRTELLGDIPVRILNYKNDNAIPINDIADGIGYDRSTIRKLIKRHLTVLGSDVGKVIMPSPQDGGEQETTCLTLAGALSLVSKVDYLKIKNPEKQAKVIRFQEWVKDTLVKEYKAMQAKLIQPDPRGMWHPPSIAVGEAIKRNMEAARTVSAEMGVPLDLAMAKALVLTSRETGMDLTSYSRLLPAKDSVVMDADYISASQIAEIMGPTFNAYRINWYLGNNGYIAKEDGEWALTEKGREYGKVFPFAAGSGHVGYYIRWRRAVMKDSGMIK